MSTLSGLLAGVAAGMDFTAAHSRLELICSTTLGYIVSQQSATENIIRLKTDKARMQREARDAPGGEYDLNRGEAGAGGLEALDDKYATVSGMKLQYYCTISDIISRLGETIESCNS